MDFGKVLGRAWEITWRWKMLWVLGFLAALGQGGGSYPQYNYTFSEQDFGRWAYQPGIFAEEFFSGIAVLVLGLCCLALIIGIILWVVSIIARGGLIAAVQQVEVEGETSFRRAWSAGARKFWTLFGLGILAALPIILLVIIGIIILTIGITAGVGLLEVGEAAGITAMILVTVTCGGFLCCGLVVLVVILEQIRIYGERAAILEDLGWIDAFKRGWQILVENIGATLILWLIFFALGIVIFGIIFVIMLALSVPLLALFVNADPGWLLIGPLCVGGVIGAIVYAVIRSIIVAFTSSTWTLAFMELTRGDEHPQLGNLELIEEA
ncbi:MAG: hypothetical protein WBD62_10015 [Anaerolineales bacterium]|nr:hypothetical protein [Anaerolineales bacterium]